MTILNYVHILYLISQQPCHIFCQFTDLFKHSSCAFCRDQINSCHTM